MIAQNIEYPMKAPGYTKNLNTSHKLGAMSFWHVHDLRDKSKGFRIKLVGKYYLSYINKYGSLLTGIVFDKQYQSPFGWFINKVDVFL